MCQTTKTISYITGNNNNNIRIDLYSRSDITRRINGISRSIPTKSRISARADLPDQKACKEDRISITPKDHCKCGYNRNMNFGIRGGPKELGAVISILSKPQLEQQGYNTTSKTGEHQKSTGNSNGIRKQLDGTTYCAASL